LFINESIYLVTLGCNYAQIKLLKGTTNIRILPIRLDWKE